LPAPQLRRQLGFFDATMIVMGGIVGSGISIGELQPKQNPQPVFDLSHGDPRDPAAVVRQPGLRKRPHVLALIEAVIRRPAVERIHRDRERRLS
jgi:hypothetical protein